MGQEIHRLTLFDGRAYPAYGNYTDDDGPIDVVSLDLATQTMGDVEVTLHTEELWTLKVLGGRLFAPFMDPRGFNDPSQGQYGVATTAGAWSVQTGVTSPVPIHVFDILENADGLWLFGASGTSDPNTGTGTIWRSTDDGTTWAESLGIDDDGFARFYVAVQLGAAMFAFFSNGSGVSRTWRWDIGASSEWTEIDGLTVGAQTVVSDDLAPFSVNETDLYLCSTGGKSFGQVLPASAGPTVIARPEDATVRAAVQAELPFTYVYDAANSTTGLYVIGYPLDYDGDPILYRCDTAGAWTALATLDPVIRSIAFHEAGGWLYFGTTDSRILRTPVPA